jgi:hypothetical protein
LCHRNYINKIAFIVIFNIKIILSPGGTPKLKRQVQGKCFLKKNVPAEKPFGTDFKIERA